MKISYTFILGIVILWSIPVFSQFDTDAVHLEITHIPNSNLNNADAKAHLTEVDFQSYMPTIKIGKKIKINGLINYRLYDYNFDSYDPEFNNYPDNMHHFKLMILYRQILDENWTFYAAPRVNIRTDWKEPIHNEDMFPSFTGVFVKDVIKNPNYKYGIGINVNNNNGKFRILPALYFQYKKDNMKISAFIPTKASISFAKEGYSYGFGYHAESNLTHLNLSEDPTINPNDITYLRNMNIFIYPTYAKDLGSNIWLSFKAGVTVSRLYEQYNSNYDRISEFYNDSFKPNFFLNVGVSYKVDSDKK
ncbi:DUF6268 family outer membrane beta-barrel protein [Flavobacterium ponti]|uniref:DUF6268 family outer membrane beta-barrel protein n=1 Tax=Flavobacterium ponti TaxID=665133 RepID=A0ABV9P957_9FLAO